MPQGLELACIRICLSLGFQSKSSQLKDFQNALFYKFSDDSENVKQFVQHQINAIMDSILRALGGNPNPTSSQLKC